MRLQTLILQMQLQEDFLPGNWSTLLGPLDLSSCGWKRSGCYSKGNHSRNLAASTNLTLSWKMESSALEGAYERLMSLSTWNTLWCCPKTTMCLSELHSTSTREVPTKAKQLLSMKCVLMASGLWVSIKRPLVLSPNVWHVEKLRGQLQE